MQIIDNKKISTIQQEFNEKFPFLKIEFYKRQHSTAEGSPKTEQFDASRTIGEIRSIHNSGDLSINGHLKVSTLEKNFAESYGLNAQVFRRSGDIWLQTTSTDHWTLTEQNQHGK